MLPAPRAPESQPRCRALQRLQFPSGTDPQDLDAGHEDCRSADHFHRPLSGQLEDVAPDRLGSLLDGLAALVPERLTPLAQATPRMRHNAPRAGASAG